MPEAGATVIVTVLLGSPVPVRIGLVLAVMLSLADEPVSLVASCFRPMDAAGAVWSSVNALVAVVLLPAVSVEAWTQANMAAKVEEVRQMFITTLNNWPAPDKDE